MKELYNELAIEILLRAIEDYKLLKKYGFDKILTDDKCWISKKELETFFNSNWCNFLLKQLSDLTGKQVLEMLNRE
jgi:hypothetical protein